MESATLLVAGGVLGAIVGFFIGYAAGFITLARDLVFRR